jgi:phenylalanyl-tRNA synthetase alpha chain
MSELLEKIAQCEAEASAMVITDENTAEAFRLRFLSRKGLLNDLFEAFKQIPSDQKKSAGQSLNALKNYLESRLQEVRSGSKKSESLHVDDFTRSSGGWPIGSRHPISIVRSEILEIFSSIGFTVAEGPEIEDDWHVFGGLNFADDHPARDMQDTFFIDDGEDNLLLRTHTSSVQVREMEKGKLPIRMVMPGRVFRNEAISARAHCQFHQIEGLYIDEGVSFADMKQTLQYFTESFFGKAKIRLRPSFFPFTEPSAEMDVYWGLASETDYRITKGTGWLEIMGCGMVDPRVLQANGIDPSKYSGFAFGMGIERIAMLRYQIGDLRNYFENDMRFLKQFASSL